MGCAHSNDRYQIGQVLPGSNLDGVSEKNVITKRDELEKFVKATLTTGI